MASRVHIFTPNQWKKFADAVGIAEELNVVCSGPGDMILTSRLRKIVESAGGLRDWPKHTDDPLVNYAVDCIVADRGEEPTYDEQLYVREVEAFKDLERRQKSVS